MLNLLRIHAIPHQLIVNKVDERLFDVKKASSSEDMFNAVLELRKVWSGMQAKLQLGRAASFSEMLFCSSVRTKFHRSDEPTRRVEGPLGIDGLRWAILQAAGKDCYESGKPRLTNVLERQMLRRLEKTVY